MDFKAVFLCLQKTLIFMQLLALGDGTWSPFCCKYDTHWNFNHDYCIGYRWNNSQCITINKCEADDSNKCPASCFLLEDKCVSDCPVGSFKDWNKPGYCTLCNQSCLSCFDQGPNHCNSCSQGYYLDQESCVSYCPDDLITYQGKCVPNCPSVLFNNTCVETCPKAFYADRIDSTCKACDEECIECFSNGADFCKKCRHFSHDKSCVRKCPVYYDTNGTCTDKCSSVNFIHEGMCVDSCPANSYYTENKCVKTCQRGMYILGRKCLQKCPSDHPFSSSNFTCLNNCRNLRYKKHCLDECPSDSMVIYSRTCVTICPSEFPVVDLISHQCVKSCAYVNHTGICSMTCPDNTFADIKANVCLPCDNKCLQCTGPLPTDCIQCKQYVNDQFHHRCSDECAVGYYSHGNGCYKLCVKSETGDEYNRAASNCFQNCNKTCVVHCPTGQVVSSDSIMVFNKTVGIYFISESYTCVRKCSHQQPMAVEVNNLLMCVEKCPDEIPYTRTGICSAYLIWDPFYLSVIPVTFVIAVAVISGCIYNEKKMGMFSFRKDERQDFNELYKQYISGKFN